MAVGGIGSSMSSYLNYTSSIHQLWLRHAVENYKTRNEASASSASSTQSSRRSWYTNRSSKLYDKSGMEFLVNYNSAMSSLAQSANALRGSNPSGAAGISGVKSSDTSAAGTEQRDSFFSPNPMTPDAQQTAKAQVNTGAAVNAEEKAAPGILSVQRDSDKIAFAVENLVRSYNSAAELLNQNISRGSGVSSQLQSMKRGLDSVQSLEKAGITMERDGTLRFDRDTLVGNMQKEPDLVRDVISGRNGIAQALYDRGSAGLRMNSARLLENSRLQTEVNAASGYNFMNAYSKTGVNSLNNYMALGLMIDYLV